MNTCDDQRYRSNGGCYRHRPRSGKRIRVASFHVSCLAAISDPFRSATSREEVVNRGAGVPAEPRRRPWPLVKINSRTHISSDTCSRLVGIVGSLLESSCRSIGNATNNPDRDFDVEGFRDEPARNTMQMNLITATRVQAATYLLGVCLFSISFLVFLNSSVSFVLTDIIHQQHGIGDAVGTLGFADELVALVACPVWGILSDRIGVRSVASIGYAIVGVSLMIFVQPRQVYPDLVLARMLFSVGGAATVTMVTAMLPSMTAPIRKPSGVSQDWSPPSHRPASSISSELTITPARLHLSGPSQDASSTAAPTRLAGFVGMFTGCGALVALGVFLPLPTKLKDAGTDDAQALRNAFYIVGVVALVVSAFCFVGLRGLRGETEKGWRQIWLPVQSKHSSGTRQLAYTTLVTASLRAASRDPRIMLSYLGGFVARASSVGISLFIPLFVNTYFMESGLCEVRDPDDPAAVKSQCRAAYLLAAKLTGISQLCALLTAPIFGYLADRSPRLQLPLLTGALCGILGYSGFASLSSPLTSGVDGSASVYVIVSLVGVSQIGAIVCSLGLLSRAVDGLEDANSDVRAPSREGDQPSGGAQCAPWSDSGVYEAETSPDENSFLLPDGEAEVDAGPPLRELQGTLAGTYSLLGGAGILLLTKLGGRLFDTRSHAAPFEMLAIFNLLLFVGGLVFVLLPVVRRLGTSAQ